MSIERASARSGAPGRELYFAMTSADLAREPLTPAERLWVYSAWAFLPLYAGLAAVGALLAGPQGRGEPWGPWAYLVVVAAWCAVLHLYAWWLSSLRGARRAQAVLSRPLREGRHVWAVAEGDRVRVWRVEPRATRVPHLWPLALGVRGEVLEGREFAAEEEADAAHEYAAELEQLARRHPGATALARAINGAPIRA